MNNIIVDIIGGEEIDKCINNLMHGADLFNKNKKIVKSYTMEISGNPNIKKLCMNIKNSFEKMNGFVYFVGIKDTNNFYMKENINTIVMKKQKKLFSYSFKEFITLLGYDLKKSNLK